MSYFKIFQLICSARYEKVEYCVFLFLSPTYCRFCSCFCKYNFCLPPRITISLSFFVNYYLHVNKIFGADNLVGDLFVVEKWSMKMLGITHERTQICDLQDHIKVYWSNEQLK